MRGGILVAKVILLFETHKKIVNKITFYHKSHCLLHNSIKNTTFAISNRLNLMLAFTYTYHTNDTEVKIYGFLAFLLAQGEQWDYACVQADVEEYHRSTYARMDAREVLKRELEYWNLFYYDNQLLDIPNRDYLLSEGVFYLLWQAEQALLPISEADKLTTDMTIHLDAERYLYKIDDTLGVFQPHESDVDQVIFGFPAQLLTYAACCTIERLLDDPLQYEPEQIITILSNWLHSPSEIWLQQIVMDIPDVYLLYENYVSEEKSKQDKANRKRYAAGQAQPRYFMPRLREQVAEEAANAVEVLRPYMTTAQLDAYSRYLQECQQYIADRTKTRKKARSVSLDAYWQPDVSKYHKQAAVRGLKRAVADKNAAAALAQEVCRQQQKGVMVRNIRPYSRFVEAVNQVCGSSVKQDSFTKHMRG